MSELDARFDRWVAAGLIDADTATRLRVFESTQAPQVPEPAVEDVPAVPAVPAAATSLALIGEVIGYLGAVLAISAIGFMVDRTWVNLSTPGKLVLVGLLLAVVAVAGVAAARVAKPPAARLASVLFLSTVALSGWFTWVTVHDATGLGDHAVALWVTGVMTAVAALAYWFWTRALPQVALLVSLIALAVAVIEAAGLHSGFAWGSIAVAAIGAVWVSLAITRRLRPERVGLVTGGLATVAGLEFASFDNARGWLLTIGLLVSVAMLVVSVVRRGESALIVPGAIGLLIMVPQLINHLFSDTLATWLAVLVTGVALVGVAVWMVRERTRNPVAMNPGDHAVHSA